MIVLGKKLCCVKVLSIAKAAGAKLYSLLVIESNLSLYSLCYTEACNEYAGPTSASLRPRNTAPFEEMLQRWQAVGNTVSDLTGPRFKLQTSRSRDERVSARPTGLCTLFTIAKIWLFGYDKILCNRN